MLTAIRIYMCILHQGLIGKYTVYYETQLKSVAEQQANLLQYRVHRGGSKDLALSLYINVWYNGILLIFMRLCIICTGTRYLDVAHGKLTVLRGFF